MRWIKVLYTANRPMLVTYRLQIIHIDMSCRATTRTHSPQLYCTILMINRVSTNSVIHLANALQHDIVSISALSMTYMRSFYLDNISFSAMASKGSENNVSGQETFWRPGLCLCTLGTEADQLEITSNTQ